MCAIECFLNQLIEKAFESANGGPFYLFIFFFLRIIEKRLKIVDVSRRGRWFEKICYKWKNVRETHFAVIQSRYCRFVGVTLMKDTFFYWFSIYTLSFIPEFSAG